jgi:hypothetical protein
MSATTGVRAKRRELALQAADLHAGGQDIAHIAVAMGVTVKRAQHLLSEGIRMSLPDQSLDDIRATTELRLNRAASRAGALMDHEDPRIAAQAIRDLATIERDRARLFGANMKAPPEDDFDDDYLPRR